MGVSPIESRHARRMCLTGAPRAAYLSRHPPPARSRPTMDPDHAPRRRAALEQQGLLNPAADSVRDAMFVDSDFFDPRDIVQVRYEMLRAGRVGERSVTETAAAF